MSSPERALVRALTFVVVSLSLLPAQATIPVPSDGSDGAFAPSANVQIDLSQAVTGSWDQDNAANTGKGVFDAAKWAVVFKYSSVNIPTGVTVTFKNHPSGAPVVWLVQDTVTVMTSAVIDLNGANGNSAGGFAQPGPGGFRGGSAGSASSEPPAGFGPGGGTRLGYYDYYGQGSYATRYNVDGAGAIYGNAQVIPLIGGSGGSGSLYNSAYQGGGAGGGAILIAAGNTLTVNGTIKADGGTGYTTSGSGGAVRLIADTITANTAARVYARSLNSTLGFTGGEGRIRIEANTFTGSLNCTPNASIVNLIGTPPVYWPPSNIPAVTIAKIAGADTPSDPWALLSDPDHYSTINTVQPIVVQINATNVPLDWNVGLRIVPFVGKDSTVLATTVRGDETASVCEATITPKMGVSSLQVRAYKP